MNQYLGFALMFIMFAVFAHFLYREHKIMHKMDR